MGQSVSTVFEKAVKGGTLVVLLIGIAIAVNTLFPSIRGNIAMGIAAGLLLLTIYRLRSL